MANTISGNNIQAIEFSGGDLLIECKPFCSETFCLHTKSVVHVKKLLAYVWECAGICNGITHILLKPGACLISYRVNRNSCFLQTRAGWDGKWAKSASKLLNWEGFALTSVASFFHAVHSFIWHKHSPVVTCSTYLYRLVKDTVASNWHHFQPILLCNWV